jgi:hypothetical protein
MREPGSASLARRGGAVSAQISPAGRGDRHSKAAEINLKLTAKREMIMASVRNALIFAFLASVLVSSTFVKKQIFLRNSHLESRMLVC